MANENTDRNNMLRGLIKHDKISSIMKDAVASPIGSSSRKQAKNIISVLKKINPTMAMGMSMDGAGGPGNNQFSPIVPAGMSVAPQEQNMSQAPANTDYSRLVVFPSAPTMKSGSFSGGAFENYKNPFTLEGIKSGVNSLTGGSQISDTQTPPVEDWRKTLQSIAPSTTPTGQESPAVTGAVQTVETPKITTEQTTQPDTVPTPATTPTETPKETPVSTETAYSTTQGAVDKNIGASMFAVQMMADPQKFKAFMKSSAGIDIPDDQLPTGGTLAENINNLSDNLRKSNNLDSLLNAKNTAIENGVSLTNDLTDYIRGRDEYLNQTQDMITKYQDGMSKMDLSNPEKAKQADNYLNYLYTLKGRQSQRYVDFLNAGITEYNKKLTEISNNYNKALSNYQYELGQKTALTTDEYNMYNTALMDMYNKVEAAPAQKIQMQLLNAQLKQANLAIAEAATGNTSSGTPLAKDLGILSNLPVTSELVVSDKSDPRYGQLSNNVTSINDAIDNFSASGGVSPYSVVYYITDGMQRSLDGSPSYSAAIKNGEKYLGMANDFANNAADTETLSMAHNIASKVASSVGSAVTKTLLSNPKDLSTVTEAVKSLTDTGWFGNKKMPSREQFLKDNLSIDSSVLNSMYTLVDDYKTQNAGASTDNILVLLPDGSQKKIKDLTPEETADFIGKTTASQLIGAFVNPSKTNG